MKNLLSYPELLLHLIKTAPKTKSTIKNNERVTTSIRLTPEIRAWVKEQSLHLGISIQDFILLILKGVWSSSNLPSNDLDLIVLRFFQLFQAHNINTADILNFLPEGVMERSDLKEPDKIINMMNDSVANHICNHFNIQASWLKGCSEYPHMRKTFYKQLPSILKEFVKDKLINRFTVSTELIILVPPDVSLEQMNVCRKGEGNEINLAVILKRPKNINGITINTYELWDELPWSYWRSRHHIKALMYFCEKNRIYIDGRQASKSTYNSFVSGKKLLAECIENTSRFYLEELVWDDDRNTELDELKIIIQYFDLQKGTPYLKMMSEPYSIINKEDVINDMDVPKLK